MGIINIKKWIWYIFPGMGLTASILGIFMLAPSDTNGSFNRAILIIAAVYLVYVIYACIEAEKDELNPFGESLKRAIWILVFVTAAGIILRVLIGLAVPGYPADMSCWTAWSQAAAGEGLFNVYENTPFLDYPPGYLYILHLLGTMGNILGIEPLTPAYNLLLKIPAILADLGMVWIIFIIGKKRSNLKLGVLLAILYSINPLTILNSAAWGQIDSILTLAVAAYLILLYREKIFWASIVFTVGLLLKPQMLFFGPVLAVVFIRHVIKSGFVSGIKTFFAGLGGGLALFVLVVLPFSIGKEWTWILSKYMGTINSYPYATLNAANLFGLLQMNWKPIETELLGVPLSTWGMAGLIFSISVYFVLSFINRNKANIFLLASMLMTGLYTLGHKMHERYLFPIMAILVIGILYQENKEELPIYGLISAAIFVNVAQVLAVIHIPPDDILFRASSLAVIVSYVMMLTVSVIRCVKSSREPEEIFTEDTGESQELSDPADS